MSSLQRNLLPDEQIVYSTKKHYIIFFTPFVWTVGAIILFFFNSFSPTFNSNFILSRFYLVPTAIAAVTWINQYLYYVTSEFAVTTKRIMMKEGFFTRHANELRLATVSNVTVNQSLLGQFLDYGIVIVNPFGGNNDIFTDIAHPFEFHKQTQAQLDKITRTPQVPPVAT